MRVGDPACEPQACTTLPDPRASEALAWDDADGYVLMFGGNGCSSPCGDTWSWDGASWTQRCTGCVSTGNSSDTEPSARQSPSMIFSAARNSGAGEVILTAGEDANGLVDGTWRWAGGEGTDGQWHGVQNISSPSARTNHRMAYDENTGLIMLYGGCTANCGSHSSATLTDAQ